jgi:hypothetical protein
VSRHYRGAYEAPVEHYLSTVKLNEKLHATERKPRPLPPLPPGVTAADLKPDQASAGGEEVPAS